MTAPDRIDVERWFRCPDCETQAEVEQATGDGWEIYLVLECPECGERTSASTNSDDNFPDRYDSETGLPEWMDQHS